MDTDRSRGAHRRDPYSASEGQGHQGSTDCGRVPPDWSWVPPVPARASVLAFFWFWAPHAIPAAPGAVTCLLCMFSSCFTNAYVFVKGVYETLDVAQSEVRVDARVGRDRKCSQSSLSRRFLDALAERLTKF